MSTEVTALVGQWPELLTVRECAERLKVSTRTLHRYLTQGDAPAPIRPGAGRTSKILFRREAVGEWLLSREQKSRRA